MARLVLMTFSASRSRRSISAIRSRRAGRAPESCANKASASCGIAPECRPKAGRLSSVPRRRPLGPPDPVALWVAAGTSCPATKNSDCRMFSRSNSANRYAAALEAGPSGSPGCDVPTRRKSCARLSNSQIVHLRGSRASMSGWTVGDPALGSVSAMRPIRIASEALVIIRCRTTRRAIPSASVQNVPEACMMSTTSLAAVTNSSASCSFTTSGGATFSTMKLLPQICVRKPWRNSRITTTWPNIPG